MQRSANTSADYRMPAGVCTQVPALIYDDESQAGIGVASSRVAAGRFFALSGEEVYNRKVRCPFELSMLLQQIQLSEPCV
jgi:hypothetical protein